MSEPVCTILAGPPGDGPDLLRAALRQNAAKLRSDGVDIRSGAAELDRDAPHRLLVLNAPAAPRLAALAGEIGGKVKAVVYVEPPQASLLARVERGLLSGRSLERQLRQPQPLGYHATLERYEQAFGGENVDFRISGPAHLHGEAILEDFWRVAGLPGDHTRLDLGGLSPAPRLSLEGALILDRLITQHRKWMDPQNHRHTAAAAIKAVSRIAGRPFGLSHDHVAAVLEASRDDIDWLAARVDASALAEPRPRHLEPAWAMDAGTLDSIAALIVRAARQTADRRARRAGAAAARRSEATAP